MIVREDGHAAGCPLLQGSDRADGGHAEAIVGGIEAFRDYLTLVARRELGPDLAAKVGASDLVQETFLAAGRDIAQFQGAGPAELRCWLKGILQHLLANTRRRYRGTRKRRVDREVAAGGGEGERAGGWWPTISASATSPSGRAMRHEREEALSARRPPSPSTTGRSSGGTTRSSCRSRRSPSGSVSRRRPRKIWGRALLRLREALGPGHDPR